MEDGGRPEPDGAGMGELLQPWERQQSLPNRGHPRWRQAEGVTQSQAQGGLRRKEAIHRRGKPPSSLVFSV